MKLTIDISEEDYNEVINQVKMLYGEMLFDEAEGTLNGRIKKAIKEGIILTQDKQLPDIKGITLLSLEEYQELKPNISLLNRWWWLRSPGLYDFTAAFVYGDDGRVYAYGHYVVGAFGVRPALVLESSNLQIGDNFEFGNHTFTVISDKKYALCNDSIGDHCFREDWKAKDANDYEASDVKKYIEDWYEKALLAEKQERKEMEEEMER